MEQNMLDAELRTMNHYHFLQRGTEEPVLGYWNADTQAMVIPSPHNLLWVTPDMTEYRCVGPMLSPREIMGLGKAIIEQCALRASSYSTKRDKRVHPDVKWEDMMPMVQMLAHTVAQSIAGDLLLMRDESRPSYKEPVCIGQEDIKP